eukprot:TRINITY_DN2878_c0_g1_i1.p1 TRINITY_DN2878_c0_g1~~TRINITY_DN2878_c0_g1_i1.p1  ORF type:complete len:180 (-),score=35.98 TRINITY_DN2878_c0_g1_i1:10-549(-)
MDKIMGTVFKTTVKSSIDKKVEETKNEIGAKDPKQKKVSKILKLVGLGLVGVCILFSILSFIFPKNDRKIWLGVYLLIVAGLIFVMEYRFKWLIKKLDIFLQIFWFRAGLYGAFSIPCFFSKITIVVGVLLILFAIGYCVAAFFKENDKDLAGVEESIQPNEKEMGNSKVKHVELQEEN